MDVFCEILVWQGHTIEIRYNPNWLENFREVYGYALAHLQICEADREPLPITETGYKSHFARVENIEDEGGAVAYVRAWLDHAAQSKEWINAQESARQFLLL